PLGSAEPLPLKAPEFRDRFIYQKPPPLGNSPRYFKCVPAAVRSSAACRHDHRTILLNGVENPRVLQATVVTAVRQRVRHIQHVVSAKPPRPKVHGEDA